MTRGRTVLPALVTAAVTTFVVGCVSFGGT